METKMAEAETKMAEAVTQALVGWYFDHKFRRLLYVTEYLFGGVCAGAAVNGKWCDNYVIATLETVEGWNRLSKVADAKKLVNASDYQAAIS